MWLVSTALLISTLNDLEKSKVCEYGVVTLKKEKSSTDKLFIKDNSAHDPSEDLGYEEKQKLTQLIWNNIILIFKIKKLIF